MTDPSSGESNSGATKVVIGVDDAPQNLAMLEAAVRAGGYTFLGAASGAECLSLLTRIVPRLILLDVEMPELDGFETCRRIRMNPHLRAVPVAFLTARRTADDVKQGIAVGGNDFIIKPFDVVKLLGRVRHWTQHTIRV
jgi:two-component system, OmpR family, response regulator